MPTPPAPSCLDTQRMDRDGENEGRLIPDLDGDSFADFAIGNAIGAVAGGVRIYW